MKKGGRHPAEAVRTRAGCETKGASDRRVDTRAQQKDPKGKAKGARGGSIDRMQK